MFDVEGTGRFQNNLLVNGNVTMPKGNVSFDGINFGLFSDDNRYVAIRDATSHLYIYGDSALYINSDTTNVGIGTNTPQQKLEVNGNMRLTTAGYFEAGNNPNQLTLDEAGKIAIGTGGGQTAKVYIQALAGDDDWAQGLTIISPDMIDHITETIGKSTSKGNAGQMSFAYI